MAITYSTGDLYNNNTYTTSSITYSTAGNEVWYYYNNEGELMQGNQAPSHNHEILPSHTHGNWGGGTWQAHPHTVVECTPSNEIKFYGKDGQEVMKLNSGVEMKVGGKWVKVEEYLERLDQLDSMMNKMYELLSPYQRKKLMFSQLEKQDEEFEHFDSDLFKV